jgi:hypothetical protein
MSVHCSYVILCNFHSLEIYMVHPWNFAMQGSRGTWPLVRDEDNGSYCYKGIFSQMFLSYYVPVEVSAFSSLKNCFKILLHAICHKQTLYFRRLHVLNLSEKSGVFNKAYEVSLRPFLSNETNEQLCNIFFCFCSGLATNQELGNLVGVPLFWRWRSVIRVWVNKSSIIVICHLVMSPDRIIQAINTILRRDHHPFLLTFQN